MRDGIEMAETLHEMAVRRVGDRCTLGCAGCPAKALWDKNDICLIRLVLKAENCEEQIEGLKAWAKEHPEPMYPSWQETWLSLFPYEKSCALESCLAKIARKACCVLNALKGR